MVCDVAFLIYLVLNGLSSCFVVVYFAGSGRRVADNAFLPTYLHNHALYHTLNYRTPKSTPTYIYTYHLWSPSVSLLKFSI
ncbi:uncharacterized protein J3D65DRAFT_620140 [Phyllosticta citribraziliensis]|uniref:Secreted protein n=1 Tax=Phyllosticta citribraziliensis TaxID=989973 RepID=A0ABR1LYT6_9PEZI